MDGRSTVTGGSMDAASTEAPSRLTEATTTALVDLLNNLSSIIPSLVVALVLVFSTQALVNRYALKRDRLARSLDRSFEALAILKSMIDYRDNQADAQYLYTIISVYHKDLEPLAKNIVDDFNTRTRLNEMLHNERIRLAERREELGETAFEEDEEVRRRRKSYSETNDKCGKVSRQMKKNAVELSEKLTEETRKKAGS